MKRLWPITILLCLLLAAGCIILVRCPRTVPTDQCSEVYRRYKDRDDLSVAFVKDYRIGDSITVDVTTIEAKDSASWESLLRGMNVNEVIIKKQREAVTKGLCGVNSYFCERNHPEKRIVPDDKTVCSFVTILPCERTMHIFNIEELNQSNKILYQKLKDIINKNIIKKED